MFNFIFKISNIVFGLLGYSFQAFKTLHTYNKKTNLYFPYLHFFQKKNVLFSFFRYTFYLLKFLIIFITDKIKIYLKTIFLFNIIFSDINLLIRFFECYLYLHNLYIYIIFAVIKLILNNIKQFVLKQLDKYKDNTKFLTWYHDIYGNRRKWIKNDGALFFVSHFIVYNLTLAFLVSVFTDLIYLGFEVFLSRRLILTTKQFRSFLFTIVELFKILVYLIAFFAVIREKYPDKIPLFSVSTSITIGNAPGSKKTKLKMPDGYSLNDLNLLDKDYY